MSARLFTEVREKRGLCYSVYASYHTLRDRGGVFCYAGTTAERAQETLDVTLGELTRLAEGVETQELDRLKARIKSALIMQQESSSARSSSLARDWYHLGRARTLDEVGRRIDELTCASINAYLAEHPPRDFTIVTLGRSALEVPQWSFLATFWTTAWRSSPSATARRTRRPWAFSSRPARATKPPKWPA